MLNPIEDQILIQPSQPETVTRTGIILPDAEQPQEGTVLAVGPGRVSKKGVRIPLDISVGDVVIYSKYGGTEVKHDGVDYLILRATDVLAVSN